MNKSMFHKVLFAGLMPDCGYPIFLNVSIVDGRFSISGVEGPLTNGNAKGGCGQIRDSLRDMRMEGDLTKEQVREVLEYWQRWHLNDLNAGSPDQETFLRLNPLGNVADHYYSACTELANNRLNPDPHFMNKDGEPYSYGEAWNSEELPAHVLEFFVSLPPSTRHPNWV